MCPGVFAETDALTVAALATVVAVNRAPTAIKVVASFIGVLLGGVGNKRTFLGRRSEEFSEQPFTAWKPGAKKLCTGVVTRWSGDLDLRERTAMSASR